MKWEPKFGHEYLFQGVWFDDGWEFDAPCVLYSPVKRFGDGGNSGHLVSMVEDVCIDVTLGEFPEIEWHKSDLKEFDWRGWDASGFPDREGWHLTIPVTFHAEPKGEIGFRIGEVREEFRQRK